MLVNVTLGHFINERAINSQRIIGATYNPPVKKSKLKEIFLNVLTWSLTTWRTGKQSMTISVKMFGPALPAKKLEMLIHSPSSAGIQFFAMGLHWKIETSTIAIHHPTTANAMINVMTLKRFEGNRFKYNWSIESFTSMSVVA